MLFFLLHISRTEFFFNKRPIIRYWVADAGILSDPFLIFKIRSNPEPVFRIRSNPDPVFRIWSNPDPDFKYGQIRIGVSKFGRGSLIMNINILNPSEIELAVFVDQSYNTVLI